MANTHPHLLLITTGGTIAGRAASAEDNVGYRAGELTPADLLAAVPALAGVPLRTRALAQVDSKDMSHALWQALVRTLVDELAREDVAGVVITHGTDTLEETAFFLQRVLAPAKPVVLTAAMRPATSLQADGPQNLLDAVTLARTPGARGVLLAFGGQVHAGDEVRKVDAYRLQAFDSGPAGPLALMEEGRVLPLRPWPQGEPLGAALCETPLAQWPKVGWITSHASFDGALVDAAVAAGFDGLVLAGTGNGTLHAELQAAAERAAAAGVALRVTTRCASGRLVGAAPRGAPASAEGSAAQARVALLLALLAKAATPSTPSSISA
jgi:L-asparaginase